MYIYKIDVYNRKISKINIFDIIFHSHVSANRQTLKVN